MSRNVFSPETTSGHKSWRTLATLDERFTNDILIVEDEPDMRQLLAGILETDGYRTLTAGDGSEALACLRGGSHPSLILLDLVMPGMNGWGFLAARRRYPAIAKIPVVAISAYGQTVDPEQLGAVAMLPKPFDLDELLALVKQHCAKRGER